MARSKHGDAYLAIRSRILTEFAFNKRQRSNLEALLAQLDRARAGVNRMHARSDVYRLWVELMAAGKTADEMKLELAEFILERKFTPEEIEALKVPAAPALEATPADVPSTDETHPDGRGGTIRVQTGEGSPAGPTGGLITHTPAPAPAPAVQRIP